MVPFSLSDGSFAERLAPDVDNNGTIAVASTASRLFAVARGSENHVYYTSAPPGANLAPWKEIPSGNGVQEPVLTDAAPAVTIANGLLYVVVKTPSHAIFGAVAEGL